MTRACRLWDHAFVKSCVGVQQSVGSGSQAIAIHIYIYTHGIYIYIYICIH